MTRDELLSGLNDTGAVLGLPPVGPRVLLDWVEERLLDGPVPIGASGDRRQNWVWSDASLVRARKIQIYKCRGLSRMNELAVQLWLDGQDLAPDLVQKAFASEAARDVNRMRRRMGDFRYDDAKPSKVELRGLGDLDQTFAAAGLAASDAFYTKIARLSQWSDAKHSESPFNGLFGATDEINDATIKLLKLAKLDDINLAREKWRNDVNILRNAAALFRRLEWKPLARAYYLASRAIQVGEGARLFVLKHLNVQLRARGALNVGLG